MEATQTEQAVTDATPKVTDEGEILQALESIIFASPKAISLVRLRTLLNSFNYETSELPAYLTKLEEKYQDSGFQMVKVAGGYQFRSHPKCSDLLQKLLEDKPARLSPSALEVLAIVAYKQPVTRAEIDSVRGIDSGHLMKGLLEKNLIRTAGHAETPGRPLLYTTTSYFLEVFSLGSLDEMPAMDEFKRELVRDDAGNSSDIEGDGTVLAADPLLGDAAAFLGSNSSLAANPDRGSFDEHSEDITEAADFGLADRAREEAQS
ncbi:MAG: SMC-Scp complex subunit ScpB [Bdellovibrionales bacterium]|nr:SMC-Scp complex subunit ScpB [Bdellovibrionales bacterium]